MNSESVQLGKRKRTETSEIPTNMSSSIIKTIELAYQLACTKLLHSLITNSLEKNDLAFQSLGKGAFQFLVPSQVIFIEKIILTVKLTHWKVQLYSKDENKQM